MAPFEFGLSRFERIEVQEFESVFRNYVLNTLHERRPMNICKQSFVVVCE